MYGVVALLDAAHHARVEALWAEFREKFGVHGVSLTPVPHFSLHVAESYDFDALETIVAQAAATVTPFKVRTNGLGIFTGKEPVLYIPIIRNPDLTAFHQRMWLSISAVAKQPSPYYHPDNWRPHITLTHRDVNHDLLPQIIRTLTEREFYWDVYVDSLAILASDAEPERTIVSRFKIQMRV